MIWRTDPEPGKGTRFLFPRSLRLSRTAFICKGGNVYVLVSDGYYAQLSRALPSAP